MSDVHKLTELLPDLLPTSGRILDIGCGKGELVRWLRRMGRDAIGIDPLIDAIDGQGELIRASAEKLPVEQGTVAAVLMINSLHHVSLGDMDRALGEIAFALMRGGRLVVAEPLAEGDCFEILRPVEDETAIRAAAQDALGRADVVGFERAKPPLGKVRSNPFLFNIERHVAVLDEALEGFAAVDPGRAEQIQHVRDEVTERFATLGRPVGQGRIFLQPMRIDVFDLPAERAVVRLARDEAEKEAVLQVRRDVFCGEQGISVEAEVDGLDPDCDHLVATMGRRVVGTARIRAYGRDRSIGKIERVAVLRSTRGLGLGVRLVRFATEVLTARGFRTILLNAQVQAEGFYRQLGYLPEGEPFDDEGIPHIAMLRRR